MSKFIGGIQKTVYPVLRFGSSGFMKSIVKNNTLVPVCIQIQRFQSTEKKRPRIDPSARRPNKICDPYGQGGKRLSLHDAEKLKATIDIEWEFEFIDVDEEIIEMQHEPVAIRREFIHPDFVSGARFLHKIASVAQLNNHYPSLLLDRNIVNKNWQVVSTIRCDTLVLGGLSTHDFHLAMLIDVEVSRPEAQALLEKTKE